MGKFVLRDFRGREIKRPSIIAPTDDTVSIELGDGIERELRYTIASLKLLKAHGVLGSRDDADIPLLIWIGLHSADGEPPEDVTVDSISKLGAHWAPYLGAAFVAAYTHSVPLAPAEEQEKKAIAES